MKSFIVTVLALALSGCFMTREEVAADEKACWDAGGLSSITLDYERRPLEVSCNIGGVKYYVKGGKLQ